MYNKVQKSGSHSQWEVTMASNNGKFLVGNTKRNPIRSTDGTRTSVTAGKALVGIQDIFTGAGNDTVELAASAIATNNRVDLGSGNDTILTVAKFKFS